MCVGHFLDVDPVLERLHFLLHHWDGNRLQCSATTCLYATCGDAKKTSAPRLLLLDAVVRGNDDDDLAALLARRCSCDVIRSRDMTSLSDFKGDVAGIVLVHSPVARQLYDGWRRESSSSGDVFTAVVSDLVSQWRRRHDVDSLTPVYHVCYHQGTRLDVTSHITP